MLICPTEQFYFAFLSTFQQKSIPCEGTPTRAPGQNAKPPPFPPPPTLPLMVMLGWPIAWEDESSFIFPIAVWPTVGTRAHRSHGRNLQLIGGVSVLGPGINWGGGLLFRELWPAMGGGRGVLFTSQGYIFRSSRCRISNGVLKLLQLANVKPV